MIATYSLTPRQLEILALIAKGLSNRDIGAALRISNNTVKIHVASILRAMQVANRTEATASYRTLLQLEGDVSGAHARAVDRRGRPALAVLTFRDLGGSDAEPSAHPHLGEGIAQDLIARLSAWRWFPLIAHASSGQYALATHDVAAIGRALNAVYVIGGVIRQTEARIRVNVQLLSCESGETLWSEAFDAAHPDLLAAQDAIAARVVARLTPELLEIEGQHIAVNRSAPFDAWRSTMSGMWHLARRTEDDVARARTLFEAAAGQDPTFALAWCGRSWVHHHNIIEQWTRDAPAELDRLHACAAECFRLEPNSAFGHTSIGMADLLRGNREQAIAHLETGVRLDPNLVQALALLGQCYGLDGRADECIATLEEALLINPIGQMNWVYHGLIGLGHYIAGRHEEALVASNRALLGRPQMITAHLTLAVAHVELGQLPEARIVLARLRDLRPGVALIEHLRLLEPLARPEYIERLRAALSRAADVL